MKSGTKKIVYHNELEDEFSKAQITPKVIDDTYNYEGGLWRSIGHFLWYKVIAKPLAYLFLKIKYGHKIINKEVLPHRKDTGYFLYGNHTNAIADALIPTMISSPKDAYVIVHPNNVSMPVLGRITPSLGAIPLPGDLKATRNFNTLLEKISKKKCITIYPEAHIWPYYTKIRPFKSVSFGYPIRYHVPVYCFTNTYQKRKYRKTPRIVTYVNGPFYSDSSLPIKEQKEQLRNQVFDTMEQACKHNNIEVIQYIKAGDTEE